MFTYRYTLYTMYTALYRFLSTLKYDDLCEYFAFHVNHAARKFDQELRSESQDPRDLRFSQEKNKSLENNQVVNSCLKS